MIAIRSPDNYTIYINTSSGTSLLKHPAGGSTQSDICDSVQKFLTVFYNGVYGKFLPGGCDDEVGVMTGLWVDPTQK